MSLTDLTISKSESKKREQEEIAIDRQDDVPYGLHIHLSEREIKKLGLSKIKTGDEFNAVILMRVSRYSEEHRENHDPERNASLVITKMGIDDKSSKTMERAAKALYGDK